MRWDCVLMEASVQIVVDESFELINGLITDGVLPDRLPGPLWHLVNRLSETSIVFAKSGVFVLWQHVRFRGESEGTLQSVALDLGLLQGGDDVVYCTEAHSNTVLACG